MVTVINFDADLEQTYTAKFWCLQHIKYPNFSVNVNMNGSVSQFYFDKKEDAAFFELTWL